MEIKLQENILISSMEERHYRLLVGEKEIVVSNWYNFDGNGLDINVEIIKGAELLSEQEEEEVVEYVEKLRNKEK